ncbi:uncharacterized protein N7500_000878 [Penicillium coprophilum]|uniref:uncharacterized protein n=1 Tax=Penicillium coprophilum TaxID=36646 RepID=UPI00238BDD58|nr:uncharacterized protein N7500_000878 [Penicillium coprophilum]KAJ5178179.1 hypothetical protein N7500_000878 [Penicillium coprophilum]
MRPVQVIFQVALSPSSAYSCAPRILKEGPPSKHVLATKALVARIELAIGCLNGAHDSLNYKNVYHFCVRIRLHGDTSDWSMIICQQPGGLLNISVTMFKSNKHLDRHFLHHEHMRGYPQPHGLQAGMWNIGVTAHQQKDGCSTTSHGGRDSNPRFLSDLEGG